MELCPSSSNPTAGTSCHTSNLKQEALLLHPRSRVALLGLPAVVTLRRLASLWRLSQRKDRKDRQPDLDKHRLILDRSMEGDFVSSRSVPSVPNVGATIESQRRPDPMTGIAEHQTSVAAVAFVFQVQHPAIRPSTNSSRLA